MPGRLAKRLSTCLNGRRVISADYVGYDTLDIRTDDDRRLSMEIRTLRLYEQPSNAFVGYLVPEIRIRRGDFSLEPLNGKFGDEGWTLRLTNERTVEFVGEQVRVTVEDPWNGTASVVRQAFAFAVRRVLRRRLRICARYVRAIDDDEIYRYDVSTGLWSPYVGPPLNRVPRLAKRPFDTHDELRHLFVMRNVALDTRNGRFVLPRPEHLCVRSTAYEYEPRLSRAHRSAVQRAFRRWFPMDEAREGFWRFMASVVRGDYPSDSLPILTVTGGSAAVDLLRLIVYTLDRYAKPLEIESSDRSVCRMLYSFDDEPPLLPNTVTFHLADRTTTTTKLTISWVSAIIDQIRAHLF